MLAVAERLSRAPCRASQRSDGLVGDSTEAAEPSPPPPPAAVDTGPSTLVQAEKATPAEDSAVVTGAPTAPSDTAAAEGVKSSSGLAPLAVLAEARDGGGVPAVKANNGRALSSNDATADKASSPDEQAASLKSASPSARHPTHDTSFPGKETTATAITAAAKETALEGLEGADERPPKTGHSPGEEDPVISSGKSRPEQEAQQKQQQEQRQPPAPPTGGGDAILSHRRKARAVVFPRPHTHKARKRPGVARRGEGSGGGLPGPGHYDVGGGEGGGRGGARARGPLVAPRRCVCVRNVVRRLSWDSSLSPVETHAEGARCGTYGLLLPSGRPRPCIVSISDKD